MHKILRLNDLNELLLQSHVYRCLLIEFNLCILFARYDSIFYSSQNGKRSPYLDNQSRGAYNDIWDERKIPSLITKSWYISFKKKKKHNKKKIYAIKKIKNKKTLA